MSRRIVGPRGLQDIRGDLSGRDLAIIDQVADLRLMSGRQIETVHFSATEHETADAAARAARRTLNRLARHGLVVRLERRIGGVRAGSRAFVYALGPVGHRILQRNGARPRYREPSTTFVDHTLAVTQLVVDIIAASRSSDIEVLGLQGEPRCWREHTSASGHTVLRPDLFVSIGVGDLEHRWFCEVDRGTEHLPALLRKCRLYETYYASGREQARHGVFPRAVWIVPDRHRAQRLRKAIDKDRQLTNELFVVTITDRAIATLTGASDE